jgi:hypothetical protein
MRSKIYWVFLRASDGLTIKVTDQPVTDIAAKPHENPVRTAGYYQTQNR